MNESIEKLVYAARHPIETARISAITRVLMFNVVTFSLLGIGDGVSLATGSMPLLEGIVFGLGSAQTVAMSAHGLSKKINLPAANPFGQLQESQYNPFGHSSESEV